MVRKLLFLLIIALICPGCVGRQNKILNQSSSLNKISSFAQQHSFFAPKPASPKTGSSNTIIMIIIIAIILILIGMAIEHLITRDKQSSVLPTLSIEPFFMPKEWRGCIKRLYQDLENAKETICIASYWITHLNIIMALRMARKRSVSVEIIFDKSTPNVITLQQLFRDSEIKFTISEVDAARMHHKFIVIDGIITWVGSANLTGTAFKKNYENMVRIQSTEIAQRYLIDFKILMRELGSSTMLTQKAQQSTESVHTWQAARQLIPHDRPIKLISDYQKKVLDDFGIDWQGLNYDEAYAIVDRVINSAWRLLDKRNMKK